MNAHLPPIVVGENLSRFYGMILGLNNVSFAIRPGITGIVGPNGAGKTTLFRLLLGQIRPSSGTLRVFGEEPWANPSVQARLAYELASVEIDGTVAEKLDALAQFWTSSAFSQTAVMLARN